MLVSQLRLIETLSTFFFLSIQTSQPERHILSLAVSEVWESKHIRIKKKTTQ